MGNLAQETTGYNTSGDGIAQWLGNRLIGLQQRGNHTDLAVQLDYIVWELHNTEKRAYIQLIAQSTVEGSTKAFQDYYERCNPKLCMQDKRIMYAKQIYDKYL